MANINLVNGFTGRLVGRLVLLKRKIEKYNNDVTSLEKPEKELQG